MSKATVEFGDYVYIKNFFKFKFLVVDLITDKLLLVAWKDRRGKVREMVVLRTLLERADAEVHKE